LVIKKQHGHPITAIEGLGKE